MQDIVFDDAATTTTKTVDFAITLRPEAPLQLQLGALTDATYPPTINHTAYPPLRRCPIAVSIQTKLPGRNENQARAQLAVWGAAHLLRLERMTEQVAPPGKRPPLPTLPLVLVSGVSWHLYFLALREGEVVMMGSHPLGETGTLLGAYKLLHGMRALADWSVTLVRWWEVVVGGF